MVIFHSYVSHYQRVYSFSLDWVLQVLIGTIENGCLGVATLLLLTQKRCACRHEAKAGSQKLGKCDCDVQSEPITCNSAAKSCDSYPKMVPRHGHFTWRLMIMGFWGALFPDQAIGNGYWQVAGLVNQISKRVEWGGCKFWISKRKSSSRLNLNQPWIVSAILSYIYNIYIYICILGCSVL